ncbi:EF-P beta-lysylation protein EpmB [unidentified bacterial endosymbiont]|uniref:EF-P beta-lysylation protein EpmB n=1 Tax=unidentified bacterial endosymbiont TaxID=2355 RepID=UPI00209D5E1C|nr:EF-P beta-lysylation protein EpmB [unidentified bacterial endosymbiont]
MVNMITQSRPLGEAWLQQLADVVTRPQELLRLLQLEDRLLQPAMAGRNAFPLRVPRAFIARMRVGDPDDPLLRQVLISPQELLSSPEFSPDPLHEQQAVGVPGLLHKYPNRVLMVVKGGCAVHCRYCFRRHFPYQDHPSGKQPWQRALAYIAEQPAVDEVIWSGGDPLMAQDQELDWLLTQLEAIPQLQRLRIHTRLPIVIPARITEALCRRLATSRFQILLVTHVNHANEIDATVSAHLEKLRLAGVTLLNQAVLLRGVNDSVAALLALSLALFKAGVLPYYLHQLDKVQGAAHFLVSDDTAQNLWQGVLQQTSGYLVPRLVREVSGALSKTPLPVALVDGS